MNSELLTDSKHEKKRTGCRSRIRWPRKNRKALPRHSGIKLGNPKCNCSCHWQWMWKAKHLSRGTLTAKERQRKAYLHCWTGDTVTKERPLVFKGMIYSLDFWVSAPGSTFWGKEELPTIHKDQVRTHWIKGCLLCSALFLPCLPLVSFLSMIKRFAIRNLDIISN